LPHCRTAALPPCRGDGFLRIPARLVISGTLRAVEQSGAAFRAQMSLLGAPDTSRTG
jgi:hypothetical protein